MLKVSTFIYRHLQGNPDQQRFTIRPAMTLGGAAQIARGLGAALSPKTLRALSLPSASKFGPWGLHIAHSKTNAWLRL